MVALAAVLIGATAIALTGPLAPVALPAVGLEGLDLTALTAAFWTGGELAETAAQNVGQVLGSTTLGEAAQELADALQALAPEVAPIWEQIREEVWEPVSQLFAQSAEGIVQAFVNNLNPSSIWASTEYPTLSNNPWVSQIAIHYMEGAPITEEAWFQYGDAWSAGGPSIP
jgi:hypothetical protein